MAMTRKAYTRFENRDCSVSIGNMIINIFTIYHHHHHPHLNKMRLRILDTSPNGQHTWMNSFITHDSVITGDFNFHLYYKSASYGRLFNSILESHGLRQHVTGAIHQGGHPLDIVISRELRCTIAGVPSLYDPGLGNNCSFLGDYVAVRFMINMEKPSFSLYLFIEKLPVTD